MPETDVEGQIKEAIIEKLGVDESKVTPTASFINDLGADSLDTVELIMELENRFNIQIPDEDQDKITTVGDAITYVKSKITA
jgi:acyl carrier protein